jgi:hypothetical protein
MNVIRSLVIPRVHRHVSDNVTTNIFNEKTYKLKTCSNCLQNKIYSDFYVKENRQDMHPASISERDLRNFCISCYDEKNKNYNKGGRPKFRPGNTLEYFICDEVI